MSATILCNKSSFIVSHFTTSDIYVVGMKIFILFRQMMLRIIIDKFTEKYQQCDVIFSSDICIIDFLFRIPYHKRKKCHPYRITLLLYLAKIYNKSLSLLSIEAVKKSNVLADAIKIQPFKPQIFETSKGVKTGYII